MFSVPRRFIFADSHRKLASYIPFAFMLALRRIYIFRSMNFDAFLPRGPDRRRRSHLGGALVWEDASRPGNSPCTSYRARGGSRIYATRPLAI
ncbi:MAG: hypothetical protein ACLTMP_05800 [Eggerthella lenta]